jgi:trehalose/maltose hydrolase-like predicted phosphorylase
MSTVEMRSEVHKMIDEIDDAFLAAVHALLGTYKQQQKEAVIGYEVDGTPITAAAFIEQADELMAEVERGEYVTLKELEQESESWLKRTK